MNYQPRNLRLFFQLAAAILILAGCAARISEPIRLCPGKESGAEALAEISSQSQNAVPLRANGQCLLRYYAEGKEHKESFLVKLWVYPPGQIYLQGDVAFDPKGVILGSNENEFWLSIKLKEVSSYWWGRWSEAGNTEELIISPKTLLEALGIMTVGSEANWSLSKEGAFDVLTKRDGAAQSRKIYIDSCDYLVRKIEYFNSSGRVVVVTELDEYREVCEGFFVPAIIEVFKYARESIEDSVAVTLSLRSIKSVSFSAKQRGRLFERPEPRGLKHIYRVIDGDTVEQPR